MGGVIGVGWCGGVSNWPIFHLEEDKNNIVLVPEEGFISEGGWH